MVENVQEVRPPEPPPPPPEIPRQTEPRGARAEDGKARESQTAARDETDAALKAEHATAAREADIPESVARYGKDDLAETGPRSTTYGTELLRGPDDRDHFVGDRVDTWRDASGRARDSETDLWAKDDNRPATATVELRAEPDIGGERRYDTSGDMSGRTPEVQEAAADVRKCVDARNEVVDRRDELWNGVKPLCEKLDAATGEQTRITDFHPTKVDELLAAADEHLSPAEAARLEGDGLKLIEANNDLREKSENLGAAGGRFARAQEFADHDVVSGGDPARGTPGNLDCVALRSGESPSLVAFEEKGAGGTLGSKLVDNPADPGGVRLRAEQGSPEYLRDMLQQDNKLTQAVLDKPDLRDDLQNAVENTRYVSVHTDANGVVTVTDFKLAEARLRAWDLTVLPDLKGRS